jgi:hypothetical protein
MITKDFSTAPIICWLMATSTFALAAEVTVSQILPKPAAFDGQHVTVSGTAQYVCYKTYRRGAVKHVGRYTFRNESVDEGSL